MPEEKTGYSRNPDYESVTTNSLVGVTYVRSSQDPQTRVDAAPENGIVVFDPSTRRTISSTINVTTQGLTLLYPRLKLADNADTQLIKVEADDVTIRGFDLDGNKANNDTTVSQISTIRVESCDDCRVADGVIKDAARHGVHFYGGTGSEGHEAENIRGDGCQTDVVSLGGNAQNLSDVSVEDIRGFNSVESGTVEVNDGVINAVVKKVYGSSQSYAIALQDHNNAGELNIDVTFAEIDSDACSNTFNNGLDLNPHKDITFRDIRHEDRMLLDKMKNVTVDNVTFKNESGPFAFSTVGISNLSVKDISCQKRVQIKDCDDVTLTDIDSAKYDEGSGAAIILDKCRNVSVRGVTVDEYDTSDFPFKADNCDSLRIRDVEFRNSVTDTEELQVEVNDGNTHGSVYIEGVERDNSFGSGIKFRANNGTLEDFGASHNFCSISDGPGTGVITDNI